MSPRRSTVRYEPGPWFLAECHRVSEQIGVDVETLVEMWRRSMESYCKATFEGKILSLYHHGIGQLMLKLDRPEPQAEPDWQFSLPQTPEEIDPLEPPPQGYVPMERAVDRREIAPFIPGRPTVIGLDPVEEPDGSGEADSQG